MKMGVLNTLEFVLAFFILFFTFFFVCFAVVWLCCWLLAACIALCAVLVLVVTVHCFQLTLLEKYILDIYIYLCPRFSSLLDRKKRKLVAFCFCTGLISVRVIWVFFAFFGKARIPRSSLH